MVKIEIKSIFGKILFTYEKEYATIKDAVEQAIKENVDLSNSDLRNSDLSNSDLRNSDFSYSDLRNSDFSNSNLRNSDFSYSDLSNSDLSYSDLSNSDLSNSDLRNSDFSYSNLRNSDFSYSNFSNSENKKTSFLPLFCKWSFSIIGDKIQIGCEQKNIEEWDLFFNSSEVYSTERNTEDFKRIEAVYNACKAYLLTLNK